MAGWWPRLLLLSIAGLVFSPLVAWAPGLASANSAVEETTKLSMPGRTIELDPSRNPGGSDSDVVLFRVSGPTPQILDVEVLDFVVDSAGKKTLLPAGSTAHTLDGVLDIGPYAEAYVPDGTTQSFAVEVRAQGPPDSVRFGGIRVTMTPSQADSVVDSLGAASGVVIVALVVPDGFDGALPSLGETRIETSPLRVKPLFRENLLETLLPDIPGVINRGPIALDIETVNTSSGPVFLDTRWEVLEGPDILMTQESGNILIFAGQVSAQEVHLDASAPGSERPTNILSSFGLVDVVATTRARLGSEILDSSEQSATFLVVRWKEPFATLLCAGVILILLWRSRKTESSAIPERHILE